jgi:hypothetical protein
MQRESQTLAPGPASFLDRPGLAGTFGAIMDEYARAAEDFCRVLEGLPPGAFEWTRASSDPDTQSVRAVCAHVANAARGYANYIRDARGIAREERAPLAPGEISAAVPVRSRLAENLRYTEGALAGLYDVDEATYSAIRFQVRWGPTYDPEMILEHAIVHLLRHRRQLERWALAEGRS